MGIWRNKNTQGHAKIGNDNYGYKKLRINHKRGNGNRREWKLPACGRIIRAWPLITEPGIRNGNRNLLPENGITKWESKKSLPVIGRRERPPHCRIGLEMIVNIDQANYVKDAGETAGIRLVVHGANRMPFPEDEGITVSPGHSTSIGLQKVSTPNLSQLPSSL